MSTEDLWGFLFGSVAAPVISYFFLSTYLNPEKDRATKFLIDYIGRWSMFRGSDHRYEALAIGLTMLLIGVVSLLLFIRELLRFLF